MKFALTLALYGVLAGLIAAQPRADDIDIYRNGFGVNAGPIRVMFALDLRPEGADIVCTDAAAGGCRSALGDDLYAALDLFGLKDGGGYLLADRSADGLTDLVQTDPEDGAATIAERRWPGVEVDYYDVLRAAFRVVLTDLSAELRDASPDRAVEVGLMAMHADNCVGAGPQFSPDFSLHPARGCSQGAYVLNGFTDVADPAELDKLFIALAALPDPGRRAPWMAAGWAGHPYKIRDLYLELYRYLSGQPVFNGFLGTRDYGSRASGNLYHSRAGEVSNDVLLTRPDGTVDQPLLTPAMDILLPSSFDLATDRVSVARYVSPIGQQEACPRVTMVNLQFGAASDSHADTTDAIAAPVNTGGLGLDLAAGTSGDRSLVAWLAATMTEGGRAELASAASVQSYFFARASNATSDAMAVAGATGRAYPLADPQRLVTALRLVFADVGGESRTLVAASTLVNDQGQSRFGRDVYFAMFQPEPGPRWSGNIKKLKIAGLGGEETDIEDPRAPQVVAQAPLTNPPVPAISVDDGLILPDALTFWTDPGGTDVLAFDPGRKEVPGRDGRSVTRGGAGQQIGGFLANTVGSSNSEPGARQVFTLDPLRAGELLPLDATPDIVSAIGSLLDPGGTKSEAQKLDLVRWIRGQDSFDADGDDNHLESRGWLLADPLHSKPLAVSYGARPGTAYSRENPDIRLFFGTNDGFFHVVRNTSASGAESGQESWAFMPPEMLGMQSMLAQNRVTGSAHPYGLDGEAVALVTDRGRDGSIDVDEGDVVWVFIGQRRGGRGVHAFDLTNPDRPRFMWAIDNLTPGFEQLALTFSTPRIAHLDLGQAAPTAVLVFAGGYNGGWEGGDRIGKDAGTGSDPFGNAVYVVDPTDGSLIWRAVGPGEGAVPESGGNVLYVDALTDSIPSPLSLLDSDHNGVDDRGYFGDSGGNIWRIDFTEAQYREQGSSVTDASNWYISRLAVLGESGEADRRFFHAPDVVQSRDSTGDYDGVLIVSGNRAAPRDLEVRNFAYLLKDRKSAGAELGVSGLGSRHDDLVDITGECASADTATCIATDLVNGWKLELESPGEKGLSTPLVTGGTAFFTSYVPHTGGGADSCAKSEGTGRVYAVRLKDGAPALPQVGELKLEDDSGRYQDIGPGLHGDVVPYRDQVLIPGRGMEEGPLVSTSGRTRWRAYWREEGVDDI
jgi:type IV pilus assembly protein PilY1